MVNTRPFHTNLCPKESECNRAQPNTHVATLRRSPHLGCNTTSANKISRIYCRFLNQAASPLPSRPSMRLPPSWRSGLLFWGNPPPPCTMHHHPCLIQHSNVSTQLLKSSSSSRVVRFRVGVVRERWGLPIVEEPRSAEPASGVHKRGGRSQRSCSC